MVAAVVVVGDEHEVEVAVVEEAMVVEIVVEIVV